MQSSCEQSQLLTLIAFMRYDAVKIKPGREAISKSEEKVQLPTLTSDVSLYQCSVEISFWQAQNNQF